jgi:hypothetical protein
MKVNFAFPSRIAYCGLILVFLLLSSCTTVEEVDPDGAITNGQAGYLLGKVTDHQGYGVSNATIYIEHPIFKDRGAQTSSSADGKYKLKIVEGLGQWVVKGYVLTKFNGRVYKMLLHPDNSESFTIEEKPVRHFEWKLQGHYPDLSLNLLYGGSAELYPDPNSEIYDTENVEFTFTPDGPLIDGSAGKVLKLSGGKSGTQNKNIIHDIPIGKYKVSARYKTTGKKLLVADVWNEDQYGESITVSFFGTESSYRANQMGIGFTDRF